MWAFNTTPPTFCLPYALSIHLVDSGAQMCLSHHISAEAIPTQVIVAQKKSPPEIIPAGFWIWAAWKLNANARLDTVAEKVDIVVEYTTQTQGYNAKRTER